MTPEAKKSKEELVRELRTLREKVKTLKNLQEKRKKAQSPPLESDQTARLPLESSPDVIISLDRDGTVDYINRTYQNGTAEKIIGTTLYQYLPSEYRERFKQAIEQVFQNGKNESFELAGPNRTWQQIRIIPIKQAGKITSALAISADITDYKRAEEKLRESEELYRALFEQAADSILLVDAETGEIVEFNDRAYQNLGYSREEFKKLGISDFEVAESPDEIKKHMENTLKSGTGTFETKHRTKEGKLRDIMVSSRAVSIGGRNFLLCICRDITAQKKAEETLKTLATHDPLMGLWNRSAILNILQSELVRAGREQRPIAVAMADLDRFKLVNDTYGHAVGDSVLIEVAERMRASSRVYDSIGRYGGEEFLIVMPGCDAENARKLAERLRKSVCAGPLTAGGVSIPLTISLGIAVNNILETMNVDAFVCAADVALYKAKEAGRNRVELATAQDKTGMHLH